MILINRLMLKNMSILSLGFGGYNAGTGSLASRTLDTAATAGSISVGSSISNSSNSSRGLSFKEVLAALVLLTRGTQEEKIKCKYYLP